MTELLTASLLILAITFVFIYVKKFNKNKKMPFSDTLKSNNRSTKE